MPTPSRRTVVVVAAAAAVALVWTRRRRASGGAGLHAVAHRTSMAADLERGRRMEVEAIQGELVRRAARHGLSVPAFETAYAVLQALDSRAG